MLDLRDRIDRLDFGDRLIEERSKREVEAASVKACGANQTESKGRRRLLMHAHSSGAAGFCRANGAASWAEARAPLGVLRRRRSFQVEFQQQTRDPFVGHVRRLVGSDVGCDPNRGQIAVNVQEPWWPQLRGVTLSGPSRWCKDR
jgi:hypothetical protein